MTILGVGPSMHKSWYLKSENNTRKRSKETEYKIKTIIKTEQKKNESNRLRFLHKNNFFLKVANAHFDRISIYSLKLSHP